MKLSRILIYPIKSLDGLEVSEAEVTALGSLRHDREWALADTQGNFINAKKEPRLHQIRTTFDPNCTEVTVASPELPAERFTLTQSAPLAAWFSRVLKKTVHVIRDSEQGFPDDLEANGPTVVGESSLVEIAMWFGLTPEETRRRFRSNLEISEAPVFWEDRLFGKAGSPLPFQIGQLTLLGTNPCQRCAVPTRDPETGDVTLGFQKRLMELRQRTLPSWSEASRFDHFYRFAVNTRIASGQMGHRIRLGNPVILPGLQA